MRELPILFSAPMIRAILQGRKTVTRRVVKGTAFEWLAEGMFTPKYVADPGNGLCPYGHAGDRLWVKETWRVSRRWDAVPPSSLPHENGLTVAYAAGGSRAHDDTGRFVNDDAYSPWDADWMGRTRSPIHMPRWASRITLEVTAVRVERLQDISEAQAIAEGIEPIRWGSADSEISWRDYTREGDEFANPRASFGSLWRSINGAESIALNPWVWAVEFRRVER